MPHSHFYNFHLLSSSKNGGECCDQVTPAASLAQLDSVLGAPALCCVNGIALCVSGMGFMWRLCGSVYVRFRPLLAYAGLSWPSLAACTAGHPAETQFRKELPDRGTGTKPACDRLRGSWGRSWCPVRLLPFWPCKTASKPCMWRYVADMGIMLRYVINGIELGQVPWRPFFSFAAAGSRRK